MKDLTPLKSIRMKCRECTLGPKEIRYCTITGCPLYLYRFGTNPKRKGQGPRIPPFLKKHQAHDEISELKDKV